jgi:hypothetical protein
MEENVMTVSWHASTFHEKSLMRPFIGDKHKTSRQEGCFLTFLTDWLVTSSRWRLKLDNSRSQFLYFLLK